MLSEGTDTPSILLSYHIGQNCSALLLLRMRKSVCRLSGNRKISLQLKRNTLMNIRVRIEVAEVLACEVISNTGGLRLAGHGIIEY